MKKSVKAVLLFLVFFSLIPRSARAWLDCPYGRTNDPYPGKCGLYVDTNHNQICDRSEAAPARLPSVPPQQEGENSRWGGEVFWFIFLPALFYLSHWYLVKQKVFSPPSFRFCWNWILLLLFIPGGLFGLLLALGLRSNFLLETHQKLGVSFVVVALFHLFSRLSYFWQRFKK